MVVALAIVAGMVGVIVPLLPGSALVAIAVGGWSVANQQWWLTVAVTLLFLVALILKYAIPARATRDAASTWALGIGAALGLVGFFVVPVVGLPLGFVVGVLGTELVRLRQASMAWQATWQTIKSLGIATVVELLAVIVMAALWVTALALG